MDIAKEDDGRRDAAVAKDDEQPGNLTPSDITVKSLLFNGSCLCEMSNVTSHDSHLNNQTLWLSIIKVLRSSYNTEIV